jgi:hypothetical protein
MAETSVETGFLRGLGSHLVEVRLGSLHDSTLGIVTRIDDVPDVLQRDTWVEGRLPDSLVCRRGIS